MFKAGATFRDKNRIREMKQKNFSAEQISQVTRVKIEHVKAILKQIEAGTLHVSRAESRVGNGTYGEGEDDSSPPPVKKSKESKPAIVEDGDDDDGV